MDASMRSKLPCHAILFDFVQAWPLGPGGRWRRHTIACKVYSMKYLMSSMFTKRPTTKEGVD